MDPAATETLERDRMIKNPDELLKIRNEVREIYYPELVKKVSGNKLPKDSEELRQGLDAKLKELAAGPLPEEEINEETGKREVPQITLRNLDEEGWERLGWGKEKRESVKHGLREVLHIGEHEAENTLHILIGQGKTYNDVMEVLNDRSRYEQYNTAEGRDVINQHLQQELSERIPGADPRRAQKFLYVQEELGIDRADYIRRFILTEDYREALNQEYDEKLPTDLYDLAWNIGHAEKNEFGLEGMFPILQMQIQVDKDGKTEGRYVVNQGNFMRWMRSQMWNWFAEFDTDELTDYFSKIELHKGPLSSVHLVTMLFDRNRYFRDETGHMWSRLYDQALLEPWMMYTLRSYYLEYEKAQSSEEKLSEVYNNVFFLSKLTRKIYGKSMMNLLMTLPVDFEGKDSDTKLGEAWSKMFLTFYNMADFEELQLILGKDSEFFKRSGWMKAMQEVNEKIIKQSGMPPVGESFLGTREADFNNAFNGKEEIQDTKAFTSFINLFSSPVTPSTAVEVINQAVRNAVKHQIVSKDANLESEEVKGKMEIIDGNKIEDEVTLNYAWLLARTWTFFTGTAAKNNFPGVSGHNAETKWLYPMAYRMKYVGYGGAGNPYTIPMFKQLSLPLLEGMLVENANDEYFAGYDEKGKPKYKTRKLTPMEVMRQMHASSEHYEEERKELRKELEKAEKTKDENKLADIKQRLEKLDEVSKNEYKILAGDLEFNENAMRNYAQNIIGRSKVLYEQLMGGAEIDFDKFTKYDGIFRGVSFDRAEFQKAVQGGLITPLRYLFDANGATQLNMIVRSPEYRGKDEKGKPIWKFRDMPLGEAMLGHQILDIPEFRQKIKNLDPKRWQIMKQHGYKVKNGYVIRPDGKHDIDYNLVQENKTMVYKQWMLMKLGADMWTHIDRHSTDPAYGMEHYFNVLDAIASIPGNIDGSDTDMRGTRITDTFFSKEQMKWLKKISGTTASKLFMRQFFKDLLGDKKKQGSMFGDSFSVIIGAVFRGY
ncbi:MAG TPA: hypothetical protein VLF93_03550 [Candidatus Saccharimonadales bacterium]|nr:hypothetical protein [Candidatus Saccharimonadales bacterium]